MNVILSSFVILITCYVKFSPMWMSSLYCLLSYLSLVMLSLLLCECHLVPLFPFYYVTFAPMWMSSCLCLLSYLSLVMLSLLLCECHLVFPLCVLLVIPLFSCYVKLCSDVNVILSSFYCLLSRLTLVTLSFSYVNVILSSLYFLLSYLSLVMLSFLLCECHLVLLLLSFVILITCYVKFVPMWMSSCFPSIVFCHTYHWLC